MGKIVLHLLRKSSQLNASFIKNQIVNHSGFEPVVIFCEERYNQWDGGYAINNGFSFKVLNIANCQNTFQKLKYSALKFLSKRQKALLQKYVREIGPDVIHLHYGTDAGIYLEALRGFRIPKVVSFYGYECSGFPRRFFGYGKKYLQSRVYRYADKVFAMSPDMKKDILSTGCPEEKIKVHYYGSDLYRFKRNHEYKENQPVRFIIISGLVPQKGHLFLLQAFKEALIKNNNITLTIFGDGPLKNMISQFISQNGWCNCVSMPGPVIYGSEEHVSALDEHDVFIHPSITDVNGDKEGIPGAIVEAMAAGLPVISTYHAGIPYIIESGQTGLLVNEQDVDALSEAILTLANSVELRKRYGKAGQEFALNNLDLKMKEQELEAIYSQLIDLKCVE